MKKFVSLFAALVMLINMVAVPALADGISGTTYDGLSYDNIVLTPNGESFANTETIYWKCSGSLYNEKANWWLGLIGSWSDTSLCTISKVYLEVYKMEKNIYGQLTVEEYYTTLFSNSYDYKTSVDFSSSGTMKLGAGKYKLVLKADYSWGTTTICKYDFSVYERYGVVDVIYKLSDGTVFQRDTKEFSAGTHTIYNEYYDNNVTLISSPSHKITVDSNGNTNISTVEFVFEWNRKKDPTPTPKRDTTPPTKAPVTPAPYDPDHPFLYGIEEYDYCLAPEYIIDPTQKPWDYCYLYSIASDINGRNMGKYYKGDVVKVIEYYGGNHGKFNYCYVITKDNKLGYMHDYALRPVDEYGW